MGFTKPTKPVSACDWQQLAGRSSSAGGGDVDLWVWCVGATLDVCVAPPCVLLYAVQKVLLLFVVESPALLHLVSAPVL